MSRQILIKKAVEYSITLFVILSLNFVLPRMMPGDPFLFISGESGEEISRFSDEQKTYYMEQYGFDQPMHVQFGRYLKGLVTGDLGYSIYYNDRVSGIIVSRLPWTLFPVLAALFLSTVAGTMLGGISAHFRGRSADRLLYVGMILFSEIPAFLTGLLFLFLFAVILKWFPLSGGMTHYADGSSLLFRVSDILSHAVLPVLALTVVRTGGIFLLARNSILSVLTKDYIRTAKAKGIGRLRIFFSHSLRNAMLPIATRVFMGFGTLIGSAVLIENVFNYPGLGRLMKEAVDVHDYPLIQGIFLLMSLMVLSANLAADLVYNKLDPRIENRFRFDTRKGDALCETNAA